MEHLDGLWWLLLTLGPLLILQRMLHREIQIVLLLLTRNGEIAVTLFSLLFLPGVFLHELSHYLMAVLLRVRTGRFSVIPAHQPGGRLQLGFVETAATDPFRDALIGIAPLLTGGLFVGYAAVAQMSLPSQVASLAGQPLGTILKSLVAVSEGPDFWLWFYLTFTVSSMMLPSDSDRQAWLQVFVAVTLLVGISVFAGAGPWLSEVLAEPLNRGLRAVAWVFGVTIAIHLILLLPAWLLHRLISRLTGLEVA